MKTIPCRAPQQFLLRLRGVLLISIVFLWVYAQLPASSAPSAPEDTDILLPTLLIEVEDFAAEQILAELPPIRELQLPRIAPDVFAGVGPFATDAALAMPLPREEFDIGAGRMIGESSIFSTGRIGAGSLNHIVGAISLYKLGADPRFRFEFTHEGIDGYSLKSPGSGYFHRENAIDGWIAGAAGPTELEFEAGFLEREQGLQNNSVYYSTSHRYFTGAVLLSGRPAPGVLLSGGMEADYSTRIYTDADNPPRAEETVLRPFFRSAWELDRVAMELHMAYELQLADDDSWRSEYYRNTAEAGLAVEYALRAPVVLGAGAGVLWWVDNSYFFPFGLSVEAAIGRFAAIAEGGLEVGRHRFSEIWRSEPLVAVNTRGIPRPEEIWFGELELQYQLLPNAIELRSGIRYEYRHNTIDTGGFDAGLGSFPVVQRDRRSLKPRLQVVLTPGDNLELSAGYEASVLELLRTEPRHELSFDAGFQNAARRFGGGVSGLWSYRDEVQVPDIGLRSFFRISEGVELEARLQDLLEPALPDGRPARGDTITTDYPFIQPGFRFLITAQIYL